MASSDRKKGNKKVKEAIKLFESLEINDDNERFKKSPFKRCNKTKDNIFKNFTEENKDKLSAKEALGRDGMRPENKLSQEGMA